MKTFGSWGLARKKTDRRVTGSTSLIILLGVCLIGILWLFVWQQIRSDYNRTIAETSQETMNLTKAFEIDLRRVVADADKDLLNLKQDLRAGRHFQPAPGRLRRDQR